jgi:hypothetical protein
MTEAEIEYNEYGDAVFFVGETEYSLSEFLRADGTDDWDGYLSITNTTTLVVKIHPSGDGLQYKFI